MAREPLVYLAGPITGLSYDGAQDWRNGVIASLAISGIKAISPLRGKEYLAKLEMISGHGEEYAHMGSMSLPKGVVTRDSFDVRRADMILCNLLGAKAVSIGTVWELGIAFTAGTPVVGVMEDDGNVHEHMMVSESFGWRVNNLFEALHIIKATLL